jgi:hypothetical protein
MGDNKVVSIAVTKAQEYRRAHPDMATKTLARLMLSETKGLFDNLERARHTLRYIEGKVGKRGLGKLKDKSLVIEEERTRSAKMPESWSKVKPVFKLPIACNRIAFMSDFQVPFHDNIAIQAFVEWVKKKNVNTVFINADFIDFYGISDFQKDPTQRNTKEEIDACRAMLAWLRDQFPTQTIYYNLDGNHELRWERWKFRRPEIMGMAEFELETILKLNDYNIIPLKKHKYIMIGKLPVLHGHTVFGRWGSGVSKARSVFLKTLKPCIASHVHITDEYTKKNFAGEMITCWTTGCFMNIDAVEYNEHNDYNHGGAFIETDNDGTYRVENKRIENGRVY